jgi:hypothetical protein
MKPNNQSDSLFFVRYLATVIIATHLFNLFELHVSSITNRFLQIIDSRAVDTGRKFGLPSNIEESNERLFTPTMLSMGRIAKVVRRMFFSGNEKLARSLNFQVGSDRAIPETE